MIEVLLMGFLLGMRHAMESDHVAAVASLVTKSPSMRESIRLGSVWGMGHTLTLFAFGSAVMLLDQMIPEHMALMLEFTVGIMLVALGIDVMRRFIQERMHIHVHRHADGSRHIHFHSHADKALHADNSHEHLHAGRFPMRALLVGIMHGMAGSAALIVLTLQSVHSFATGMIYIALFGAGSIAGMAALSAVIMLPLQQSANRFSALHHYLQLGIGSATLCLGISIMYDIAKSSQFI
ncbi:urease accessory protein [Mariprofundus ferrooxydans]|jgi:hypothetical protein|uniref:Possible urease accessory protein n=1 Tax=Mariprofundus ferrooxydans PV-1 TaxID=314345 RepID=Q0EZV4_9PROT|nr:urease accessory protein [Mariprofundus ferrooxydans]EAU54930.1 possible urease accessory protein [Mariprofundus ferrooxydans PV-1]KON46765.1 urease accessory protein [Mariprofundus ferrooxydans]